MRGKGGEEGKKIEEDEGGVDTYCMYCTYYTSIYIIAILGMPRPSTFFMLSLACSTNGCCYVILLASVAPSRETNKLKCFVVPVGGGVLRVL